MQNNKTIWITGASSGIGEASAYLFAKEKANLILTAQILRNDRMYRKDASIWAPNAKSYNMIFLIWKTSAI